MAPVFHTEDTVTGLPFVMKPNKSLHALEQSPRNWNKTFHEDISKQGFRPTISDLRVF